MTGAGISACGLWRIVFLRPTMVDVDVCVREGSGDEELEPVGLLRTVIRWAADKVVVAVDDDDCSEESPRAILRQGWEGSKVGIVGGERGRGREREKEDI